MRREDNGVVFGFGELDELRAAGLLKDVTHVLKRRKTAEVRLAAALREDCDDLRTLALEARYLLLPVLLGDVANGAAGG